MRKMDERNQKRFNYWNEAYGARVLDVYASRDFLEITCSRGGDTIVYRVRGEFPNFSVSVR